VAAILIQLQQVFDIDPVAFLAGLFFYLLWIFPDKADV